MAVSDKADGSDLGVGSESSSSRELDAGVKKEQENYGPAVAVAPLQKGLLGAARADDSVLYRRHDPSFSGFQIEAFQPPAGDAALLQQPNGDASVEAGEGIRGDMKDLEELLSKLNPMAEEFVPPSLANIGYEGSAIGDVTGAGIYSDYSIGVYPNGSNENGGRRRKNGLVQGKRRIYGRTSMAQREEIIRRTVYVSEIDQQVTEEELAALFHSCGQVVDCRVCGDPNSVLRFAFVELADEEGAKIALSLSGTMLGFYPVRVLPSKTAIAPVDPKFLPRSEDEREMCTRTIYCTNIDRKVTQADVKLFFETVCGPNIELNLLLQVYRLRLLGDSRHATRIAFVEFTRAESAILALNCSGAILGSLPLRVSPSKTPVRPRAPRVPRLDESGRYPQLFVKSQCTLHKRKP
ncbi:hypothetical protein AXF42_Ash014512 [Apostasia shenzhenica]|uniref:RRM domain-containing protein n=1 Tax=Apostasia shenzhenica TaxID=1088818 RepID=A0A2H9ZWQ3_9ASPA|nr:hypothetical protein AXF42_Ash014512 [Apostasia shenzhenica]